MPNSPNARGTSERGQNPMPDQEVRDVASRFRVLPARVREVALWVGNDRAKVEATLRRTARLLAAPW